eukprot:1345257-Amorphochlora_amoeboformis.AAC.2
MERARQRKINAGALAPKTVNRNTDDLQDLQSKAKGLSAAQRGKAIRLQGSVRKAGGPKLTSLKLPMLQ